jgi:antitoxin FitA
LTTTSILIRDLPLTTKAGLQALAQKNNRSMTDEVRRILNAAVSQARQITSTRPLSFAEKVQARFAPLGGLELTIPPRGPDRPLPDFSGPEFDRMPARTPLRVGAKK